jgi:CRISPR system Cascade subunit CasB
MTMSEGNEQVSYHPKLSDFGQWVADKTQLLATGGRTSAGSYEKGYVQNGSYATAAVAKLCRSAGHAVGQDADIFEWTLNGLPEQDPQRSPASASTPTDKERAAHAALTLFARHQHSIHTGSMHTGSYVSLGAAVGELAYSNRNEQGIRRDFDRLQTASSWQELVRHARRLIDLLKRERIALNYGLFAQDLLQLRSERDHANAVRLRWGRDFNRTYWQQQRQTENEKTKL